MSHKTEVSIFNQVFEISSSRLTLEELNSLAKFVDMKMKETFRATNLSSALKVAVLTALNLAEEVKSQRGDTDQPSDNTQIKDEVFLKYAENIVRIANTIDKLSSLIEDVFHD